MKNVQTEYERVKKKTKKSKCGKTQVLSCKYNGKTQAAHWPRSEYVPEGHLTQSLRLAFGTCPAPQGWHGSPALA